MRTTQVIGLTDKAYKYRDTLTHKEYYGACLGMFEENSYSLSSFFEGVEEFEQITKWSSGLMIFIGLRNSKTKEPIKEYCWTDNQIKKYL